MTIIKRSAKAKGRLLVYKVKQLILNTFSDLQDEDLLVPSGSKPGEDLQLSPLARKVFPFSIECKNQESLSIWSALKQCEYNANKYTPLLIFKRNRSNIYATLLLDDLLNLLKHERNE
jgi:hypothetical protein